MKIEEKDENKIDGNEIANRIKRIVKRKKKTEIE